MRASTSVSIALALVAVGVTASAGERPYRVIVSSARQISQVNQHDLANDFLTRELKWSDGLPVVPVDLTVMSEVRRSFSEEVLANNVRAILAYWERQIFSGRRQPPPVKASDEDVIRFVGANPGAVGYVSSGAQLPEGVTAVDVVTADGRSPRAGL